MKNKNQKVGLTAMNWALSILGIIIFSLLIVLPPTFRVVFKEEEKQSKKEFVYPSITTICTKNNTETKNSTIQETMTFVHKNLKIKNYKSVIEYTYLEPRNYEIDKKEKGRLVNAFQILNGLEYRLNIDDENSTLTVTENYDLEIFTPTSIVVPGDTEPTLIESKYLLNDSITTIKKKLATNGYVCHDSSPTE